MPLSHAIQGSPQWLADYIENLVQKSRQLGSQGYEPYRNLSNANIKGEIEKLLESQKGTKYDIIPFSITGTSKPININPRDLDRLIRDEGFARRVYESNTGLSNVSLYELQDLRQRAQKTFESFIPEIRRIESEFGPIESERERLESEKNRLGSERERLGSERERIGYERLEEERRRLEPELERLASQEADLKSAHSQRFQSMESQVKDFENRGQTPKSHGMGDLYANLYNEKAQYEKSLREIKNRKREIKSQLDQVVHQEGDIDQRIKGVSAERESVESTLNSLNPDKLIERSSIEREVNRLHGQQGRIAPMNEIHERAINMLERSFNDDTMKLASEELREAKRHNELRAVEPLVRSSLEGPSDEYMNKYVNDYTKDMRKALEDESEEEYIKKIAPKVNMSFAQMGAFHSGARAKALKDTLLEHRTKLHREIAHLTGSARDKAMEQHELQKRREQSAAHLLGTTTKSEKESARHQAELLRQHAVTKQGLSQLDVAALGQVAKAKQEQQQHEMDVERQEYEKQLMYPQEQLAREAAFVSGLPSPPMQSISGQLSQAPAPPNLLNLGAGTLATLAAGFGQQYQRPYKEGGSVRKQYAHGGSIGSDDIGNEIRNIIQQQGNSDKARLDQASNHNPIQSWLRHVGNEMLSNPSEDPLLSLGRGTAASTEHKEVMRERAANLYDKIQATKLNQYQVLAEYENMKDQSSLRRENFLEKKKFLQQQQQQLSNRPVENADNKETPVEFTLGGTEFMPVTSKKEKEELLKDKKSSESILHELESIRKLSKDYEKYNEHLLVSPRTPLIGNISSGIQGTYSNITKNKNMRKAAVTKAALDSKLEKFKINMETKMRKGVLPEGMRQFMEKKEVFPSSHEPLDIYNKKLEDLLEETKHVYDASKSSLKYNIHISPYDLENMKHKSSDEKVEKNGTINMVDPEGNPLIVPKDQINQALSLGATIVQ